MALLLPLLLSGCSLFGGYDGTYLVTQTLSADSCDPEGRSVGERQQYLLDVYRTKESLVFDFGGLIAVGPPADGTSFEVTYSLGSALEYEGCSYSDQGSMTAAGAFSSDLGLEGTLTVTERTSQSGDGCPANEESCVRTYAMSGMRLDASTDRHPTGSIAWGYFAGGGGY